MLPVDTCLHQYTDAIQYSDEIQYTDAVQHNDAIQYTDTVQCTDAFQSSVLMHSSLLIADIVGIPFTDWGYQCRALRSVPSFRRGSASAVGLCSVHTKP